MTVPALDRRFFVRRATKADIDLLVPLALAFLREQGLPPDRARVRKAYGEILPKKAGHPAYLLLEDSRVVGYAVASIRPSTSLGSVMTAHDLYVEPAVRNHGAGKQLVLALLEQARKDGVNLLEMEVNDANVLARRLFGRIGFRPINRCVLAATP